MKKEKFLYLAQQLSVPALVGILGLVLLFSPDTASALIGKVAGIGLLVVGIIYLAEGFGVKLTPGRDLTIGILCLVGGFWLLRSPLALAAWIGRIAGLLFVLRGLDGLREAGRAGLSKTWPLVTTLAGVLLVLSPMITSRVVLKAIGLVLAVVGGLTVCNRIRQQKLLDEPEDPNIIDV